MVTRNPSTDTIKCIIMNPLLKSTLVSSTIFFSFLSVDSTGIMLPSKGIKQMKKVILTG